MKRALVFVAFVVLLPLVVTLYIMKAGEQFVKYEMRLK